MKVGIMQPYFLPYIGYFHLIQKVDLFIIYDQIQYTKKGWINRNQYLLNGQAKTFSIPLVKGSHLELIRQKKISHQFDPNQLMRKLTHAYSKAPFFDEFNLVLQDILFFENQNLFEFIMHSLEVICRHLRIKTKLIASSDVAQISNLSGQNRVIDLCERVGAKEYLNLSGGIELYDSVKFAEKNILLSFIKHGSLEYEQFDFPFVNNLSIADVLMFNSVKTTSELLKSR